VLIFTFSIIQSAVDLTVSSSNQTPSTKILHADQTAFTTTGH